MEDKHLSLKHRFAFGAAVSAFFCFTLLVFGPMSLYVNGNDEMWFSFRSLLLPVILVSSVGFVLLTLLLSLPKGIIHKALCCLLFGIGLGLYIQCGFFNISYGSGVLDGSQIAWKDYTTYGAIDSAMWAACLALPFALFMVFKRSWRHILMFAALFIVFLQIGGLAINLYQNQNTLDKLSHEVTVEGMYELSEEDNTIVFLVGSMDAQYYQDYKAAHPEIEETLAGFTEYENALSSGSDSLVALPSMLTGSVYKKDIRYTEFIDKSWSKYNVFDLLNRNGADVRIFADDKYFGNAAVRKVDNVVDRAQDAEAYRIIGSTMYRYTMYNAAPHYLKQLFWMSLSDYSSFKSNNTFSPGNDDKVYSGFTANGGFTYTDDYSMAVRVYTLKGAEHPYRLTSSAKKDVEGTSRQEQIEGDFFMMSAMLQDLKDNGKYKDARIIIAADCGELEYGQNALLLVKEKGDDLGYEISSAPASLGDLSATLASTVTDRYKNFSSGLTFRDTQDVRWNRRRAFYRNTGTNADSRIEEYRCNFDETGSDQLDLVNTYMINGGKIDNYKLGSELTFTADETATMYCKEGFGHTNGWRTIVSGPRATMIIPLDQIPANTQDLHAYFSVLNVYEETRCVITANGEPVFDGKLGSYDRVNGLNFLISTDLLSPDEPLTLVFNFPERPEETEIIALTSFKIYKQ